LFRTGTFVLGSITTAGGDVENNYKGCRFRSTVLPRNTIQRNHFVNCCFNSGVNCVRATMFMQGGVSLGGDMAVRGGFLFVNNDGMCQGSRFAALYGHLEILLGCVFDSPTSALVAGLASGGQPSVGFVFGTAVWGSGSAQYGYDGNGTTQSQYASALPTITGNLGEIRLGGLTSLVTQDAAGAYTPAASNTWASIANGNIQAPSRACGIFKSST
jgi:hypothetical protein